MAKFKQTGIVALLYIGVVSITIIAFTMLVNVMENTVDSTRSIGKITNFMFNSEQLDLNGNPVKSKRIILVIQSLIKYTLL